MTITTERVLPAFGPTEMPTEASPRPLVGATVAHGWSLEADQLQAACVRT
jgi:hypothetical protein